MRETNECMGVTMSLPIKSTVTTDAFSNYQQSFASRLRYKQAQINLMALHNLSQPLNILDVAGGNGLNTEYLLERGHKVTLMDSDPVMIEQAQVRLAARGLMANCRLVKGNIEKESVLLAGEHFNLILCHHVIEYLSDVPSLLKVFAALGDESGELSLITLNPVSEVIRGIIFEKDPILAEARLTDFRYDAKWFGNSQLYSKKQIISWALNNGWKSYDFRAIRVLADYLPTEEITVEKENALLELEEKLSNLEPYKHFGRYLQFAFRRKINDNLEIAQ